MPGSDFFEQELRERIQAYIMRPSGELWEKIEASLPVQERNKIFLKRYILLLPFLILSISLSKNNHTAGSLLLINEQISSKNKVLLKSTIRNTHSSNQIFGSYFFNGIKTDISPLLTKSNTITTPSSFSFKIDISTHIQRDLSFAFITKTPSILDTTSITPSSYDINQYNNNTTSAEIDKEQTSFSQPNSKKKKALFIYFSPTISDRSFNPKNKLSYANYGFNRNANQVANIPAYGWEAGVAFLKHIKPSIRIRSGIQFNYSCYNITASQGAPELATLSLNGIPALQRISNLENRNGFINQKYPNSSYQISVPVGMMIRLNKNPKSNLNIGVSVQPSYTVHASAYLLTTDYRNYVEASDMLRRFNIYSGAELVYSKKIGQFHVLAGPQLRYQLLSGHKKEYSFKENQIDYGFKLGIVRDLP
jgi:hypothetical protein